MIRTRGPRGPAGASGGAVVTTRGDVIRGGVGGAAERLGLGAAGQVLTSDGTDAAWAAASGGGGGETTYDFASATGVTLQPAASPGGAGEGAVVTGGALVLTIPNGVRRDYYGGAQEGPYATLSLLDAAGRAPSRVRVAARVALAATVALDAATTARLVLIADTGGRVALGVRRDWISFSWCTSVEPGTNGTAPTLVGSFPGKTVLADGLTDGTLWVEIEIADQWCRMRYGLGTISPTVAPTAWTEIARVGVTAASGVPLRWITAALVGSHEDGTADGDITITWDDLTVTRGSP